MNGEHIGTVEEWVRLVNMDLTTARRIYETHRPIPFAPIEIKWAKWREYYHKAKAKKARTA